MKIIIDTNIVVSALLNEQGKTRELLSADDFILYSPDFLLMELEKYKTILIEKSGISEENYDLAISIIISKIKLITYEEFQEFIEQAEQITPDPDDVEYFALALKFKCSLWSNDKRLKEQDKVKIYSTTELLDLI